ncbi:MAG TPA: hypothetical protein ENO14_01415 [Chromatiales bacterium]|nr:hypothetical protein [Chromatiales bacterium]
MRVVRFIPAVLSLLVLGAHFLRQGQTLLLVISLGLIGLVAVPRRWALRVLQAALVLGAVEWIRALLVLSRVRAEMAMPATRMTIILAAVALFTAASAFVVPARRR